MHSQLFGPIGQPKYLEYAKDIEQSGQYLLEVINDILDMSKIEAGRMALAIEQIDLPEIVSESLRVVQQAAEARNITLQTLGNSSIDFWGDRRALKQVVINLLSNAVKFTPVGGEVTLRTYRYRGSVRIAIADTGVGIPRHEIAKLGRPFEQVENQFTKGHKGTGLGLAISRSILELHGGRLEIKSRVNEGTTVTCMLPLKAALQIEEPRAASAWSARLPHRTIRSKASCTLASVSLSMASSVEKSGMFVERASRSLSAFGASAGTKGLSRQSRQALRERVIEARRRRHPNETYGWRIEYGSKIFVFATDTEPYAGGPDNVLVDLAKGADILYLDGQYSYDQYVGNIKPSRQGWGHGYAEWCAEVAKKARVRPLVLGHHDPDSTDQEIERNEKQARQIFANTNAAYDGMELSTKNI